MKPNKDTEYNEFTEWSEKLCEKRHDKLVELRKEKCGNNPFKKWFYLGKKVKITKYKIIRFHNEIHFSCEIDNIKSYFEAKNILKELQENNNTKDWFEISEYEVKGYSLEEYYNTPYDRLRWKAFKQWWKKIEKHGLVIKRPYMYYGKETYHIWNSRLEHKHCYKKFSSYSSGEEVRTVNPLIDLSNTYFTVEDIKVKRIDPKSRNSSKDLEPVELEEYDEMLDYDKQCLKETEEIINKIFGIENIKYDYIKTDSNRVYCSITVNKKIPQSDKSKVLSQINKNKFHVEIQNDKDTKTIIEIHNKELDMNHLLELSRGETNNV